MVGATGIEPVTPTMSRKVPPAYLVDFKTFPLGPVQPRSASFSGVLGPTWKARGKRPALLEVLA
jgi:hypothetical protein